MSSVQRVILHEGTDLLWCGNGCEYLNYSRGRSYLWLCLGNNLLRSNWGTTDSSKLCMPVNRLRYFSLRVGDQFYSTVGMNQ